MADSGVMAMDTEVGGGSGTFSLTSPAVFRTPSGSKNFNMLSFPYCMAVSEMTTLSESTLVTFALATCDADILIFSPSLSGSPPWNSTFTRLYFEMIENFPNKKLGFLGLSFKAGTDDLRNSPAVRVIESLLGRGADISIYDHNINMTMLTGTNKDYIDARIPHLSQLLMWNLEELVEKVDVLIVNTNESEFIDILSKVENKIIIDFVRIDETLINKDNYIGINWKNLAKEGVNYISKEDTVLI
jgi:GDP-mannose 6-dehydrogenase